MENKQTREAFRCLPQLNLEFGSYNIVAVLKAKYTSILRLIPIDKKGKREFEISIQVHNSSFNFSLLSLCSAN